MYNSFFFCNHIIGTEYPPTLSMSNLCRGSSLATFSRFLPSQSYFFHPQDSNPRPCLKDWVQYHSTNHVLVHHVWYDIFSCQIYHMNNNIFFQHSDNLESWMTLLLFLDLNMFLVPKKYPNFVIALWKKKSPWLFLTIWFFCVLKN